MLPFDPPVADPRRWLAGLGLGLAFSLVPALPAIADQTETTGTTGPITVDRDGPAAQPRDIGPIDRPDRPDLEALRLACRPAGTMTDRTGTDRTDTDRTDTDRTGTDRKAAGCAWRPATSPDAAGYQLWRSVDGGARELVWRGGLDTTRFVDRVPVGATTVVYAVLAVDGDGHLVGRSRPEVVRFRAHDRNPDRAPTPRWR